MKNNNKRISEKGLENTKRIAFTGLIFALAIVLSMIESSLPQIVPVPGVKMGLSNIAVMYALFFVGGKEAFAVAVLKSAFVLVTRGVTAGFLSLLGGLLSLLIMLVLLKIFKEKISYLMLSVSGSVFHNVGQYVGISLIYTSIGLWGYIPVLLLSGLLAGGLTATFLRMVMPALNKIRIIKK